MAAATVERLTHLTLSDAKIEVSIATSEQVAAYFKLKLGEVSLDEADQKRLVDGKLNGARLIKLAALGSSKSIIAELKEYGLGHGPAKDIATQILMDSPPTLKHDSKDEHISSASSENGDVLSELRAFKKLTLENQKLTVEMSRKIDQTNEKIDQTQKLQFNALSRRSSTEFWNAQTERTASTPTPVAAIGFLPPPTVLIQSVWSDLKTHLSSADTLNKPLLKEGLAQMKRAECAEDKAEPVQSLMAEVTDFVIQKLSITMRHRDTSSEYAPVDPHHKFDGVLVPIEAGCAKPGTRVTWPYVLHIAQYKRCATLTTRKKEWIDGRLQIVGGFEQITQVKQAYRHRVTGHLTNGRSFQLWFTDTPADPSQLRCSPLLDFLNGLDRKEPTEGFQLFARLLTCTPSDLGFRSESIPTLPPAFFEAMKWSAKSARLELIRPGTKDKASIFVVSDVPPPTAASTATSTASTAVTISPIDSKSLSPSAASTGRYVVKLYTAGNSFAAETEVLKLCGVDSSLQPFTTSLRSVYESGSVVAAVIEPVMDDTLLNTAYDDRVFTDTIKAAAVVLPFLHKSGRVHGDISPSNILVNRSDGRVRINDFGGSVSIGQSPRVWTKDFAPLRYAPRVAVGVADSKSTTAVVTADLDDYESLFYSLAQYALHDGHRQRLLSWSRAELEPSMWLEKSRCVSAQGFEEFVKLLRPFTRPLFKGLHAEIFCASPSTERVINTLQTFLSGPKLTPSVSTSIVSTVDPTVYCGSSRFHASANSHGYTTLRPSLMSAASKHFSPCPDCSNSK